jgi:thiol:disulfide interchange protein
MLRGWFIAMLLCALLQGPEARALQSDIVTSGQVSAQLLADVTTVQAGQNFLLGVELSMAPGWHTYWRNPGDSGAPIKLSWQLPEGVTIEQLGWPIPERIAYGPLTNLGYHGSVLIPLQVSVNQSFDLEELTLGLKGRWLVCADICIPESAALALVLPSSKDAVPDSGLKALLQTAVNELPRAVKGVSSANLVDNRLTIDVHFPGLQQAAIESLDFLPYTENLVDLSEPVQVTYTEQGARLEMIAQNQVDTTDLSGLVLYSETVAGQRMQSAFEIRPVYQADGVDQLGLLMALLLAFLGGLILNLMPCVFPVLSIKLLSLIEGVEKQAFQVRVHGWLYTAGVLVSFLVMAVVLLVLRAGGDQIGWGFQLQSPIVVALLFYLFCLVGLNLSGFYEFGSRLQNLGAGWPDAKGRTGAFAAGVLASVVAAPCTAPFMGVALGYAIVQPWWLALAVFAALGLGMAAPILALCHVPAMMKKLPKPGIWMVRFKEALAFPMYAAALWLLWVLVQQTGSDGLGRAGVGLLLIVFAIWLWPDNMASSKSSEASLHSVVRLVSVSCVLLSFYALWSLQSGAVVASAEVRSEGSDEITKGPTAIAFSPSELSRAVSSGMVFVNFTAAWCITCKVNDGFAIDTVATRDLFKQYSVTYMKADWTNEDPMITRALADYDRLGVPLYLLFPQGGLRAEVLPQILTQNMLLEAVPRLARLQVDDVSVD